MVLGLTKDASRNKFKANRTIWISPLFWDFLESKRCLWKSINIVPARISSAKVSIFLLKLCTSIRIAVGGSPVKNQSGSSPYTPSVENLKSMLRICNRPRGASVGCSSAFRISRICFTQVCWILSHLDTTSSFPKLSSAQLIIL